MKRIALAAGLAACFSLLSAASSRADDTVLRRDKSGKDVTLSGTIVDETPAGIKIKVGKDVQLIPPEDVSDVAYQLKEVSDIEFRTPHGKEMDALSKAGDERKKGLADALTMLQALQKRVKGSPMAQRYIEYRIAMVAVEHAQDDATKRQAAIDALHNYRTSNSGGWEIVPATRTLAHLLEDGGQADAARQAYEELAANPDVPKDIALSTNLLVAQMLVRAKKYGDAEQKLRAVLAGTTDEKQRAYVQVYLAQTQVAQGKAKDATELQKAIKESGDDDGLKALGYNALGDYYQQAKQPDEAFWQYLRVDVMYNQDREEHARALYNLWKLFDAVRSDPQRSRECLERLKDKAFAGTDYQARALKEAGDEKKSP
jgi:hypothetical protein